MLALLPSVHAACGAPKNRFNAFAKHLISSGAWAWRGGVDENACDAATLNG